jgi:hypothetical protein
VPIEMRRVVFTSDEFRDALRDYGGDAQVKLPAGNFKSVAFNDDSHKELTASISPPGAEATTDVVLSSAAVAATLLKYCMQLGIPLPRSAQKSISLSGTNIVLDFRMPTRR